MKTELQYTDTIFTIRLTIVYTISIIVFICLISSINLQAQEQSQQWNDTIWLHSGDSIACSIDRNSMESEVILTLTDKNGKSKSTNFMRKNIKQIKLGSVLVFVGTPYPPPLPRRVKFWLGPGFGFPLSVGVRSSVIFKNNFGINVNIKSYQIKSADAPEGWSARGDILNEYSICLVKEFYNKNPSIRLGLDVGVGLIDYAKANYIKHEGLDRLFGKYHTDYDYNPIEAGIIIRGRFEFLISRIYGMEVALTGNINKHKPILGIELYFMFGRVNDEKKARK